MMMIFHHIEGAEVSLLVQNKSKSTKEPLTVLQHHSIKLIDRTWMLQNSQL